MVRRPFCPIVEARPLTVGDIAAPPEIEETKLLFEYIKAKSTLHSVIEILATFPGDGETGGGHSIVNLSSKNIVLSKLNS